MQFSLTPLANPLVQAPPAPCTPTPVYWTEVPRPRPPLQLLASWKCRRVHSLNKYCETPAMQWAWERGWRWLKQTYPEELYIFWNRHSKTINFSKSLKAQNIYKTQDREEDLTSEKGWGGREDLHQWCNHESSLSQEVLVYTVVLTLLFNSVSFHS